MSNLEVTTLHGIFDASFSPGKSSQFQINCCLTKKKDVNNFFLKCLLFFFLDPNVRIAAELELLKVR